MRATKCSLASPRSAYPLDELGAAGFGMDSSDRRNTPKLEKPVELLPNLPDPEFSDCFAGRKLG